MQAAFRDGSFIMIGAPYKKSSFALVATKDIPSVSALKGKRIAVSQLADAPYNYAVGLLAKSKIGPRDVQWVPVGAGAGARAAAVAGGRADATMLTAPEYFKMEADGYKILANIADVDDIYAPSVYLYKKDRRCQQRHRGTHDQGPRRSHQALSTTTRSSPSTLTSSGTPANPAPTSNACGMCIPRWARTNACPTCSPTP